MTKTTMTIIEKAQAIQKAVHSDLGPQFWVPAVGNGQIAVFLEEVFTNPRLEMKLREILAVSRKNS